MTCNEIITLLKEQANPYNVAGMARFGINPNNTLGISVKVLRALAKEIKTNHDLALELWKTGYHEARQLASFIADPKQCTAELMDQWVNDFDSWDVCDLCCLSFFDKTTFAWEKTLAWVHNDKEFVRRAGFVMMAVLAVHDKKRNDQDFLQFLPLIEQYCTDSRNFIYKAVNWALRGIGKRSHYLRSVVIPFTQRLAESENKTTRWIAKKCFTRIA